MKKLSIGLTIIEFIALTFLLSITWVILSFIYEGLYNNMISTYISRIYYIATAFYIACKYTFKIIKLMED